VFFFPLLFAPLPDGLLPIRLVDWLAGVCFVVLNSISTKATWKVWLFCFEFGSHGCLANNDPNQADAGKKILSRVVVPPGYDLPDLGKVKLSFSRPYSIEELKHSVVTEVHNEEDPIFSSIIPMILLVKRTAHRVPENQIVFVSVLMSKSGESRKYVVGPGDKVVECSSCRIYE